MMLADIEKIRTGAQRLSASTKESQEWYNSPSSVNVGAQRLSASTKESPAFSRPHLQRHQCAQRLSASTKESPRQEPPRSSLEDVLNAFRHQRRNHAYKQRNGSLVEVCSTPFGINEGITVKRWELFPIGKQCSTPFGINEGITRNGEAKPLD